MSRIRIVAISGTLFMMAEPTFAQDRAPLRCEITRSESTGFVNLVGRVSASRAISGTYEFVVEKHGPSGRSSVMQSGDFQTSPASPTSLASTRLDQGERNHFEAKLKITWQGGQQECEVNQDNLASAPLVPTGTPAARGNVAGTVQSGGSNSSVVVQSN